MSKTIYLDWNVFQDIFKKRKNLGLCDKLIELRDKKGFKIVFSASHMRDLSKCQKDEYIRNDLLLLSDLTKNWCVGFAENGDIIERKFEPELIFNEVKREIDISRETLQNIEINFEFEPYYVDVSKLSKDNIVMPFLEEGGLFTANSMNKLISDLRDSVFNDYKKQKQFRNSLKECVEINNPANPFVSTLPLYNCLLSEESEIVNNLESIVNSFLSVSGKSLNGIPLGEKITTSYQILDFFPAFSEKLDRRNNQNNIAVDAEHLFCASASRFLICGDEKMVKKAKIIYKLCNVKTKVLTPEHFLCGVDIV